MVSSYSNFKMGDHILNILLNNKGYVIGLISNNIDDFIYYLQYLDGTFGYAESKELYYIRHQIELK